MGLSMSMPDQLVRTMLCWHRQCLLFPRLCVLSFSMPVFVKATMQRGIFLIITTAVADVNLSLPFDDKIVPPPQLRNNNEKNLQLS